MRSGAHPSGASLIKSEAVSGAVEFKLRLLEEIAQCRQGGSGIEADCSTDSPSASCRLHSGYPPGMA
eukprot:2318603-Alexandrium_andersonii.AAC.1